MKKNSINITKTYLPKLEEYIEYLQKIWENHQLTNNGPLVLELEAKLKAFLGVKNLILVSNGTLGLQIAIRASELQNEIITTPFSYVATTSSIVWEGVKPVFVDIDPNTLCIDPDLIEAAITPNTTAILTTHVYGIPCDVIKINEIAKKHQIKVIYDAAHSFGVKYYGKSLAAYGDISILSFHATKLFHTAEGGAIITNDDQLAHKIKYMRNFGHKGQEDFWGLGINGKVSELHAAMGLCVLPQINEIINIRKQVFECYDELIINLNLRKPSLPDNTEHNFIYYPVIFPSESSLLRVKTALNKQAIYPRRYFYPALTKLPYIQTQTARLSEVISKKVLCLPIDTYISQKFALKLFDIIKNNM